MADVIANIPGALGSNAGARRKYKDMGDGTFAEVITSGVGAANQIVGADGTTIAAVKPASTAPLATDPALVVAISPNGQLSAGRAADASSTPVALSNEDVTILTNISGSNYQTSRKTADGQVKATAGFLHTVTIAGITATPTAGLLTLYDSLTEANTVLYSEWVFATDVGHTVTLDIPFATGLFVGYDATLANVQVTVSYR